MSSCRLCKARATAQALLKGVRRKHPASQSSYGYHPPAPATPRCRVDPGGAEIGLSGASSQVPASRRAYVTQPDARRSGERLQSMKDRVWIKRQPTTPVRPGGAAVRRARRWSVPPKGRLGTRRSRRRTVPRSPSE